MNIRETHQLHIVNFFWCNWYVSTPTFKKKFPHGILKPCGNKPNKLNKSDASLLLFSDRTHREAIIATVGTHVMIIVIEVEVVRVSTAIRCGAQIVAVATCIKER